MFRKALLTTTAFTGFCLITVPALAQDTSASHSEGDAVGAGDIIVMARKRQESILKVPVTEAVLSAQQLQQSQINDVDHIVTRVPGLGIGQQVATIGAQISIRGVGTTTLDAGVDQSVTLNLDGLQLSQGLAFKSGLFDLAQVEVLKGPQSLYYGKNSTAGVIALHTADPTDRFELRATSGYEFEGKEWRNEFIVSGPVTPTLGLRLATSYSDYQGYYKNDAMPTPAFGGVKPADDRIGGDRGLIVRGTAIWKPAPEFDARLKVNYTSDVGDGPAGQFIYCPTGTGAITTPPVTFIGDDCKLDRYAPVADLNPAAFIGVYHDGRQIYRQKQAFGTLELHYRPAPDLSLTSVTGYYHDNARALFNGNVTADTPGLSSDNALRRHDFTEEVRLESDYNKPLNFLVGGFYQDSGVSNFIRLKTNNFVNQILHFPFPTTLYNGGSVVGIRAYSGFGQLRWKLSPKLELAGGARYTDERRTDMVTHVAVNPDNSDGAVTDVPLVDPSIHSGTWSPELTATWTPTDTMTIYGSLKQGFKSGSFAISQIYFASPAKADFGDEKVQGGELGLKSRLFDRSFFLNVAGYYYFYKGLQVGTDFNSCTTTAGVESCIPVNRTQNAGAARVYGVDLDMSYQPRSIAGLSFRGAVNWNHARFVRLDNVPCSDGQTVAEGCNELFNPLTNAFAAQDLSGIPLVRAPDWQLTGGVNYELPVSDRMSVMFGADAQYSSRYLTQITNVRASDQPAYAKIDANITLKGPDDRWELALIGNNLTDKLTYGNTTVASLQAGALYGSGRADVLAFVDRGRELWIRITYRM